MTTQISFDTPLESYLANSRLSKSLMGTFVDKGPRMFLMESAKMLPPKEQTEEQRIGQMFEDLVQGRAPDLSNYAVRPKGMKFNEGSAKDPSTGKGWKAQQDALGKEIIDQEALDAMKWMHESFLENDQAMDLIRHSKKQVTMYLDGPGAGMYGYKSRPDYLFDMHTSIDLKTCTNLNVLASGKQVREYRYHVQAALVRRLLNEHGTIGTQHVLLGVEKQRPWRCQVLRVTPDWLAIGDEWIAEVTEDIERCARADTWPRVLEETRDIAPPPSWL